MGFRISFTNEEAEIKSVEVDAAMELETLQAVAEVEMGVPAAQQELFFNGQRLVPGPHPPSTPLARLGIHSDDLILVRFRQSAQQVTAATTGFTTNTTTATATRSGGGMVPPNAEEVRLRILSDPAMLSQVARQNPALANLAMNNPPEFRRAYELQMRQLAVGQHGNAGPNSPSQADEFDIEAQRRIEDAIRKENISRNMEAALEHHPESFARVIMLYINMEVNGKPVAAFVDSGAQATIMSPDCARQLNIMHLVDERFAGIAQGVGTAKILGRVHSAAIRVGSQHLSCSFTIMEGKGVDLLFGLDMLKRHQACIDLEKNVLRINGEDVPFLAEHELPGKARQEATGDASPTSATAPPPPVAPTPTPTTLPSSSSSSSSSTAVSAPVVSSAPAQQQQTSLNFPEATIKNLIDLGFTRSEAISALQACGGNAELAASMLFSM